MEIKLVAGPFDQVQADALVAIVMEDSAAPAEVSGAASWLLDLRTSGEFTGKPGEIAILHQPKGLAAKRLVLVGGGKTGDKQHKFDAAALRRTVGGAVRTLKQKGIKTLAFLLNGFSGEAAVEGAMLGNYEPDQYKTSTDNKSLDVFCVIGPASLKDDVDRGRILGDAQNFTRDLVNEPGNKLTPTELARRAKEMADELRLDCEIMDQDRMRQLGMGSLLGVSQGSAEPPAFIVIRYKPTGAVTSKDHLALIGKGVTFDTGGISIKPSDSMEKMKYDMAGGAAVIGAMKAIGQLKPNIPVTAFIPAVENMPGGKAYRPGDILKSLDGKTIEVLNTDAEGRLILNDAITYARRMGCTHLVDAATLTGAIVVALGHVHIGAFTNNDAMLGRVMTAAKAEGEKMWHMPLDDDYKELLKSTFADLANIGGRYGGAISAAYFLKEFAGDTPWVHLDIAGTAWLDDAKPFMAKGPSGVGVRTFTKLALDWKS